MEFLPFKAAIEAGVATIMTAHVLVPSLDEKRPASLSRKIVFDVLRDELHYEGVILSDDLEMKAIAAGYAVPEAAVMAIEAHLARSHPLYQRFRARPAKSLAAVSPGIQKPRARRGA